MKEKINWKEDEIEIVRSNLLEGKTYKEISELLPGRSKDAIKALYEYHREEYNLQRSPDKIMQINISEDKKEEVRKLILDGYQNQEITKLTGIKYPGIKKVKTEFNITQPSLIELANRGIFYTRDGVRHETDLTPTRLIDLLESGKTISEISRDYKLNLGVIQKYAYAQRYGWKDKKLETAKELKKKLIFQITGKEATKEDLKKSFLKIFTKDFILDLLKRNGYSLKKCSSELDGIDPKCIAEAIAEFKIEIPKDIEFQRRFQPALESRQKNYSLQFTKFIETYFPDLEIVGEYKGTEEHIILRCKIHPEEIINLTPYGLKNTYTRQHEDGKIEVLGTPCKKCQKLNKDSKRLNEIKESIESNFPGKFDLSGAKLTISSSGKRIIEGVKCNKCGETFSAYVSDFKEHGRCRKCENIISYGEKYVRLALDKLKIPYTPQKFKDNVVPKEIRKLGISLDFWIQNYKGKEIWIEYNGKQHYNFYERFHISKEDFINQVLRDMWIKKYCKENNIVFLEIPYTYKTKEKILNLLQKIIIEGVDINTIIDYAPLYKEINELRITI